MIFVHQKNVNKTALGFAYCAKMSANSIGTVNISTVHESQKDGDIEHITLGLSVEQLFELSSICKQAAKLLRSYEKELSNEVLADS